MYTVGMIEASVYAVAIYIGESVCTVGARLYTFEASVYTVMTEEKV